MMIKEHFWNSASCFIKKFEIQFQKKQNAIIFFFFKSFISIYLIYAENIRNIMRISQDFLFLWSLKHKRVFIIQIYSIEKNIRVLWQRLLIGKWNNFFRILVVTKNKLYFLFQLMESGIRKKASVSLLVWWVRRRIHIYLVNWFLCDVHIKHKTIKWCWISYNVYRIPIRTHTKTKEISWGLVIEYAFVEIVMYKLRHRVFLFSDFSIVLSLTIIFLFTDVTKIWYKL